MKKKRKMSKRKTIASLLLYLGQKDGACPGSKTVRGADPIIKRVDLFNKRNRLIVFQLFVRCSITILGSDIFRKQ